MEKTRYDVFISYSHKDYVDEQKRVIPGNEISKIKEALTDAEITFWFDEEGIRSGDKFTEKIVNNIEGSDVFLFLSTKNACESPWTSKEIACADEFGKYIIPVRIDRTPYNKKIMFRIADLAYIDYGTNPEKGLHEIVRSVKAYLRELKASEERKEADERRKKEELERQRRQQEEEKKRQEQIGKIETEIAALEAQRTERQKAVLQKEQELKMAQVDLEACKVKIEKLQKKLQDLLEPKMSEQKKEEDRNRVFTVEGVSFKMIRVEGGSFLMGSPDNDPDAYDDEKPQHEVMLSDFYIGETQVTQALWKAVMGETPSGFKGDNKPVEMVTWNDCQEFLRKLNSKTGQKFRLPTEAEWEYAARGGNKSRGYKYAGSNNIAEVAWYSENSGGNTHVVKQKKANELGLYDMSGNVWGWCQDRFGSYSSGKEMNPTGPSEGSNRVLRGGSWLSDAQYCRVAYRNYNDPDGRGFIGFRLALVQQ